ncbi:MAG: phosphodiesterase [Bacilli bacterium]
MKLLICSDLHGSLSSGEAIKAIVTKFEIDHILCCGDFLYNGARNVVPADYNPNELSKILNTFSSLLVGIEGNCDSRVDKMVLNFPIKLFAGFKFNDYEIFATHGDDEALLNFTPKENEVIVKGHTHVPYMIKNENGGILLNPGSMTFPKGSLGKTFIIIDEYDIILYEYEFTDAFYIIKSFSLKDSNLSFNK